MTNVGMDGSAGRTADHHLADQMVPRVSTMIARGALLQERRLQVSETGEVRWVGPDAETDDQPAPDCD